MASTEEWIADDNLIWNYDWVDDFIWLPSATISGEGRWVARGVTFRFDAIKESFRYVADGQLSRYVANRKDIFRYVADNELFRYVANKE